MTKPSVLVLIFFGYNYMTEVCDYATKKNRRNEGSTFSVVVFCLFYRLKYTHFCFATEVFSKRVCKGPFAPPPVVGRSWGGAATGKLAFFLCVRGSLSRRKNLEAVFRGEQGL